MITFFFENILRLLCVTITANILVILIIYEWEFKICTKIKIIYDCTTTVKRSVCSLPPKKGTYIICTIVASRK